MLLLLVYLIYGRKGEQYGVLHLSHNVQQNFLSCFLPVVGNEVPDTMPCVIVAAPSGKQQ